MPKLFANSAGSWLGSTLANQHETILRGTSVSSLSRGAAKALSGRCGSLTVAVAVDSAARAFRAVLFAGIDTIKQAYK